MQRSNTKMRNKCEKLNQIQKAKYAANDKKLWDVLNQMTVREIALTPIGTIALEAGISKSAVYDHQKAYQRIVECREYEEQRVRHLRHTD